MYILRSLQRLSSAAAVADSGSDVQPALESVPARDGVDLRLRLALGPRGFRQARAATSGSVGRWPFGSRVGQGMGGFPSAGATASRAEPDA